MRPPPRTALVFAALLPLLAPAAAHAQQCGTPGAILGATVGRVHYRMAGGVDATAVGLGGATHLGTVALNAAYRRVLPDEGEAAPHAARLTARLPVAQLMGARVCAVGHAGGSWFDSRSADGVAGAGGGGLRVERGAMGGAILPFVELRALAAYNSGAALDLEATASGLSLGVEIGVRAAWRRLSAGIRASFDGFDGALGPTPYPAREIELAVGYRL